MVHPLLRVASFDPHFLEPNCEGLKIGLFQKQGSLRYSQDDDA